MKEFHKVRQSFARNEVKMLQIERFKQIRALLENTPTLRINQISEMLYVSEATVRRDVAAMEKNGLLKRVYGGVTLNTEEMPLNLRSFQYADKKDEIGKQAAQIVKDSQTIFIDSSSTVLHMLPYIKHKKDVTIISNSQKVIDSLAFTDNKLILTGGELIPRNLAYVGELACRALDMYRPELVFFSSQGIDADGEITDASQTETTLRRAAIKRGIQAIFLCDSSKAGRIYPHHVCYKSEIAKIITDSDFPKEYL
ncbi:MAG: DeoR/GlpR family DNA-binding transcription regulator [Clostridia bacterium]|nr:DeoR/GlpR family DNA-binding transcription regulator [Clostridia bacterium]